MALGCGCPMPIQLTWNDLLIQDIPEKDARVWLGYWSSLVQGRIAPVFMSKFGDWFLRRPDGSTDELSVIECTCQRVATTPEEFIQLVNTPDWEEEHLLSRQVAQLHERGIIPAQGLCYGFAPHPLWSGVIDLSHVQVMEIGVWQHLCAQTWRQRQSANSLTSPPSPTVHAARKSSTSQQVP